MKAAQSNGPSVTARSRVAAVGQGEELQTMCEVEEGGPLTDGWGRGARAGGVWLPQRRAGRGGGGGDAHWGGTRFPRLQSASPRTSWLKATQADCVPVSVGWQSGQKAGFGAQVSWCFHHGVRKPALSPGAQGSLPLHWVRPCNFRTGAPPAARSQRSLSAFRPWLWPFQPQPATEDQL